MKILLLPLLLGASLSCFATATHPVAPVSTAANTAHASAIEHAQHWRALPADKREHLLKKYRHFQKLPPAQQEALRRKWQWFQLLPPAERLALRKRWEQMPPGERESWRQRFLQATPAQRQQLRAELAAPALPVAPAPLVTPPAP